MKNYSTLIFLFKIYEKLYYSCHQTTAIFKYIQLTSDSGYLNIARYENLRIDMKAIEVGDRQ